MTVAPGRRPSSWLSELVANKVDVFMVCSKRDARLVLLGVSQRLLDKLTRTGDFQFTCIPELEHVHFISERRSALEEMVTDHVISHFGPTVMPIYEVPAAASPVKIS